MLGLKRLDLKETLLRSVFLLLLTSLILGVSMNKILIAFKLHDGETLVSLSIDKPKFAVWPSFMCGKNLTSMTAQAIKRGNSETRDQSLDLPSDFITLDSTKSIASGNWTNDNSVWPCFVFNPKGALYFTSGIIDQITLSAWSDQGPIPDSNGLLFGIFDKQRNISSVDPFVSPSPSENTYTFTRYQKQEINNTISSYFFVNKQNTVPETDPIQNLVAKFTYSPDTYLVINYIEKRKYTPYDLVSAIGGLITYAFAAWVIMFGRGKYRSWGLVQRYLLRNSPNANKNAKKNDDSYEEPKDIESQINKSTLAGIPATTNVSPPLGSDFKSPSTFYFSTSGSPTRTNFTYPNVPSSSLQSKDLLKSIEAMVNQKLWFVEQTLNRHYLAGFRIRKYDIDLNKLVLDDVDEALLPPTAHNNWNKIDSDSPPPPKSLSYYGGQINHYFKESDSSRNSLNSLNPEEQRNQYPNVSISQEKKLRERNSGGGNDQRSSTNDGIATGKYDGNYFSNMPVQPSIQSDISNSNPSTQQQSSSNNSDPIPSSPLQMIEMSVSSNSQEIQGIQGIRGSQQQQQQQQSPKD